MIDQQPQGDGDATKNGKATTGLVLGGFGLVAWFIPIIGAAITITGLIFSIKGLKSLRRGAAIAGIILNIAGLLATVASASIGAYIGAIGQHSIANKLLGKEQNLQAKTMQSGDLNHKQTGICEEILKDGDQYAAFREKVSGEAGPKKLRDDAEQARNQIYSLAENGCAASPSDEEVLVERAEELERYLIESIRDEEWAMYQEKNVERKWDDLVRNGYDMNAEWKYAIDVEYDVEKADGYARGALESLEESYVSGMRDGIAVYKIGNLYRNLGDCDRAVPYLAEALEILKKDYKGHIRIAHTNFGLGSCIASKDNLKGAAYFHEAWSLDPSDTDARINEAYWLAEAGKWSESKAILKETVENQGESLSFFGVGAIYNTMGWTAFKEKNFKEAESWFNEAYAIRRDVRDIEGLAWSFEHDRNRVESDKWWNEMIRLYKDDPSILDQGLREGTKERLRMIQL